MINKRTCIATGEKVNKKELIRIVKYKGIIQIDHNNNLPGRGCYIKHDASLINKLKKQKLLNKAFKMIVEESIYDEVILKLKEE